MHICTVLVSVHLTREEYRQTEQLVRKFEREEGAVLQNALENKGKTERNWVKLIKVCRNLLSFYYGIS